MLTIGVTTCNVENPVLVIYLWKNLQLVCLGEDIEQLCSI